MMNDTYLYPYSSAEARERDELPLWRESHKAVSYTHLDVYKRQLHGAAGGVGNR